MRSGVMILSSAIHYRQFMRLKSDIQESLIGCPMCAGGGTGDQDFAASTDRGYIFCGGRTNRDFSTVFKAASQLDCPTIIVADKGVDFPSDVPEHISIYRDISSEVFQDLLQGARIVVLALKRPDISSGQVVLNRAMRSGKPVIVTDIAGIDDYVTAGKDAILVAPESVDDLKSKLVWLLENSERRKEIGLAARATYERSFNSRVFARELFHILVAASEASVQREVPKVVGDL
jgi:glycosyltransferase involved in cell wall biosynthesis